MQERVGKWGLFYGIVMILAFFNGSQYGFIENTKNSGAFELLLILCIFWLYGSFAVSVCLYQLHLSQNYSNIHRILVKVFLMVVFFAFASELFNFYWIAIRQYSKFSSHVFSGLFFSPIFIGLCLVLQKFFVDPKR